MNKNYGVTVKCCLHGNCDYCAKVNKGDGGSRYGQPLRRLHSENVSSEYVARVVENWRDYEPVIFEDIR